MVNNESTHIFLSSEVVISTWAASPVLDGIFIGLAADPEKTFDICVILHPSQ